MDPTEKLLSPPEAAKILGLAEGTQAKLRCTGGGPPIIKATKRAVRYCPVELRSWIDGRRRFSISER